jgi:hypothetical protein
MLDSIRMQARLSPAKLDTVRQLLASILNRSLVTRRELERLYGKLNWICKVVYIWWSHLSAAPY